MENLENEKESFQSLKKTSEYRNKACNANNKAQEYLEKISSIFEGVDRINKNLGNITSEIENNNSLFESEKIQLESNTSKLVKLIEELELIIEKYPELSSDIETFDIEYKKIKNLIFELENQQTKYPNLDEDLKKISENISLISKNLDSLNTLTESHPDLETEISDLENKIEEIGELLVKINTLYTNSNSKKKEIDQLYFEINGYIDENKETGEKKKIEGLKDKLKNIYNRLQIEFNETKKEIEEFKVQTNDDCIELKNNWENKFVALENKIKSLLPNALTAGLSSAYSVKKDDEIIDLEKLNTKFQNGIGLLVVVSFIPFIIGIIFLFQDKTLEDVIYKLPRIVFSILPLYIPIAWFTYSANKKVNLSKRLIEEYTHKEVLSKTFEGLSTQINNLEESEVSKELKTKLLINILEVSSENPGKLISDYNVSDHPILDALDKEEKLSKAIERLQKLPGLNKISDLAKNTAKKIIEKKEKDIEDKIEKYTP